jgi:hypothetical protein
MQPTLNAQDRERSRLIAQIKQRFPSAQERANLVPGRKWNHATNTQLRQILGVESVTPAKKSSKTAASKNFQHKKLADRVGKLAGGVEEKLGGREAVLKKIKAAVTKTRAQAKKEGREVSQQELRAAAFNALRGHAKEKAKPKSSETPKTRKPPTEKAATPRKSKAKTPIVKPEKQSEAPTIQPVTLSELRQSDRAKRTEPTKKTSTRQATPPTHQNVPELRVGSINSTGLGDDDKADPASKQSHSVSISSNDQRVSAKVGHAGLDAVQEVPVPLRNLRSNFKVTLKDFEQIRRLVDSQIHNHDAVTLDIDQPRRTKQTEQEVDKLLGELIHQSAAKFGKNGDLVIARTKGRFGESSFMSPFPPGSKNPDYFVGRLKDGKVVKPEENLSNRADLAESVRKGRLQHLYSAFALDHEKSEPARLRDIAKSTGIDTTDSIEDSKKKAEKLEQEEDHHAETAGALEDKWVGRKPKAGVVKPLAEYQKKAEDWARSMGLGDSANGFTAEATKAHDVAHPITHEMLGMDSKQIHSALGSIKQKDGKPSLLGEEAIVNVVEHLSRGDSLEASIVNGLRVARVLSRNTQYETDEGRQHVRSKEFNSVLADLATKLYKNDNYNEYMKHVRHANRVSGTVRASGFDFNNTASGG